jgi:hypothetical protein
MRVRTGVGTISQIGLDLHHAADEPRSIREYTHDQHSHELGGDLEAGAIEELAWENAAGLHDQTLAWIGLRRPKQEKIRVPHLEQRHCCADDQWRLACTDEGVS